MSEPRAQVIQPAPGSGDPRRYRCDGCGKVDVWGSTWAWWCDGPNPAGPHSDPEPTDFTCGEACRKKLHPHGAASADEPPPPDDFVASFDMIADEMEASAADDDTGGGMLRCHMRDAAEALRGGDIDAALLSLDCADMMIEAFREQLRALARGEVPA